MRFKNVVEEDGKVELGKFYCELSDHELGKYQTEGIEQINFIETNLPFRVKKSGKYEFSVNNMEFDLNVKLRQKSVWRYADVTLDVGTFTVERVRGIQKDDIVRGFFENYKDLKG